MGVGVHRSNGSVGAAVYSIGEVSRQAGVDQEEGRGEQDGHGGEVGGGGGREPAH